MTFWVNTETGHVISTKEMISNNPNTIFPIPFQPVDGYAQLNETQPAHDPATQKLLISEKAYWTNGRWTRSFNVVPLTEDELAQRKKARVPSSVTRRQARRALALAGLLSLVQPAIDGVEDETQRTLMQIDWDDAQEYRRDDTTLLALAGALGLSEDDLDDLFIIAAEQP